MSTHSWTQFTPPEVNTPDQGYKLHVSACLESAHDVIQKVFPVLAEQQVPFKCASTSTDLAALLSGKGGITQVGKFITVYPSNERQTITLAVALDSATRGLVGPKIIHERSVAIDSLVHYRYGGFGQRSLQLRTGQIVPALLNADGRVRPDNRMDTDLDAYGRSDPFANKFEGYTREVEKPLLQERYLCLNKLHDSPKGSSWLAFDLGSSENELVVVKKARAHVMEGLSGLDAKYRLTNEAGILRDLQGVEGVVRFIDFWEEKAAAFLVYAFVEGIALSNLVASLAAEGCSLKPSVIIDWSLALCNILERLHQRGVVFGDLKPGNVILTVDNRLVLVDFELSGKVKVASSGGLGTIGYCSPAQSNPDHLLTYADDIYALGATMLTMVSMADISLVSSQVRNTMVSKLGVHAEPIANLMRTCMSAQEEGNNNIRIVISTLKRVRESNWHSTTYDFMALPKRNFLEAAQAIGETICAAAQQQQSHIFWTVQHPINYGFPARDLYIGTAGIALFLVSLHEAIEDSKYLEYAERAAKWLHNTNPPFERDGPMSGLYFGEAGVGLLYLRLFQATGATTYIEAAMSLSKQVGTTRTENPDLMTGVAGIGLYHLMLWHVVRDDQVLDRARKAAQVLLRNKIREKPLWKIPEGNEGLSGKEYLGFAHGCSGIAYFLAELALIDRDTGLSDLVAEVADWLQARALPALNSGSGWTWPEVEGGSAVGTTWCHGSAGVARFFLKAYSLLGKFEYLDAAIKAAKAIAEGPRWAGTTQCHGLAGNIECLLDLFQATEDPSWLSASDEMAATLFTYGEQINHTMRWPSEWPDNFSMDFMVGQSGMGSAFLRLYNPRRKHEITCEAFTDRMGISVKTSTSET